MNGRFAVLVVLGAAPGLAGVLTTEHRIIGQHHTEQQATTLREQSERILALALLR